MNTDFTERVTAVMAARGWRKSDLARAAGMRNDSLLRHYMRGTRRPSPAFLLWLGMAESVIDTPPSFSVRATPSKVHVVREFDKIELRHDGPIVLDREQAISVMGAIARCLADSNFPQ